MIFYFELSWLAKLKVRINAKDDFCQNFILNFILNLTNVLMYFCVYIDVRVLLNNYDENK